MSMAVLEQAVGLAATAGSHFHLQVTGGEPTLVPALNSQILASRERSLDSCAVLNFYGKFRLWEGFLTFSMDNIFDEEVQVSGDLTEDATNRYAYYEVGRLFKVGYEIDF
jgi:iron complex outermembrane receptor protein